MSGRRRNCCPIAFRLTSWMPYPIWSVFTHRLRNLITAVEGHYPIPGWEAFDSCAASSSGWQCDPPGHQIECRDSLDRHEHEDRQTNPPQGATLVSTWCNHDGDR